MQRNKTLFFGREFYLTDKTLEDFLFRFSLRPKALFFFFLLQKHEMRKVNLIRFPGR